MNKIKLTVEFNNSTNVTSHPDLTAFKTWINNTLKFIHYKKNTASISIALVSSDKIKQINAQFRNINKPTNILSFPNTGFIGSKKDELGEIIMCPQVIFKEITQKSIVHEAHWAHLTIHGILHLLGYDHESNTDAEIMEQIEIDCMTDMGYSNPYIIRDSK
jgi:probable rRNA maturation factor